MGFRKNPAALKANDKERWMLPAPGRKEQYVLGPDRRFPEPERQPSYTLSEPEYDYSQRRYVPDPTPSYYGPHFEKGPSQEEIWKTRKTKEVWRSDKEMGDVPFREEYRNRAHSFHQPTQKHQYSDPYERRPPPPWPDHVEADYDEYKHFSQMKLRGGDVIREAHETLVGKRYTPTSSQGDVIRDGISMLKASQIDANRGVQARAGFDQKYPQAYLEKDVRTHEDQVKQQRSKVINLKRQERELEKKYATWDRRMESIQGVQPRQ